MKIFDFFFKKEAEALQLPFNTDIHSHILPWVDDGSKNIESSLFLVNKMCEWGIYNIIATPHRTDISFENTIETVKPGFEELKEAIAKNNIPVNLTHSFEYRLDEGFINLMEQNKLVPLKGNYILIENSFIQPLWNLKEIIFDLKLKGFKPILAHPERYGYYVTNKQLYTELHDIECEFQINILSIAGGYGKEIQKTAMWLLEKGYLDYIGTDLHNRSHSDFIDNYLKSSGYRKILPILASRVKNDII
jgi:Capsular polysaccharide biosynthesis protein